MRITEMGKQDGKTLLLLPGTACTWQINFHTVIDRLAEAYHLICVNYDGFEGDRQLVFTDMLTVTGKIEEYILEKHGGHVDIWLVSGWEFRWTADSEGKNPY